ncbi:hypothetical protein EUGRSUZ_K02034 [Eucalyptus grandis]|uniref:Uncharacterized protein n=2 Tax=Eucalyptus grandis TaxID=71139 RepID=A0ACC3IWK1_EUCGR|nr:hypothetical protein EUGRSUZ_K02034 [Eucalyptus grandis]
MVVVVEVGHPHRCCLSTPFPLSSARRRGSSSSASLTPPTVRSYGRSSIRPPKLRLGSSARSLPPPRRLRLAPAAAAAGVPSPPLDLTEENIRLVLADARVELAQIFDTSVGITGDINPAVKKAFSLSPLHEVLEIIVLQDKLSLRNWMDPL